MTLDFGQNLFGDRKFLEEEEKTNKKKERFASIAFPSFKSATETDQWTIGSSYFQTDANTTWISATVQIPEGATITDVIVYGNAGTTNSDWFLVRMDAVGSAIVEIVTAKVNTRGIVHDFSLVENAKYGYLIRVDTLVATDRIYSAHITYTI